MCLLCSHQVLRAEEEPDDVSTEAQTSDKEDVTRVYKAEEAKKESNDGKLAPVLPDLITPKPEPLPPLKNQKGIDSHFKYLVGIYLKSARDLEVAIRSGAEKRELDIQLANMRSHWAAVDAYGWPDNLDERLRLSLVACSEAWELYYWVRLARLSYREVPIDANLFYYRKAESLLGFIARWDEDLAREMQKEGSFMQHEEPVHKVARKLDSEIIAALTGSVKENQEK
jgi:hypothetical protein